MNRNMNGVIKSDRANEENVYKEGDLVITVKPALDPAGVALLKRTVYGTNGVRYQHTNQESKIQDLNNPFFFHLHQGGKLVGVYCLDKRPIDLTLGETTGFYGRYLAVDEASSGKGFGHLLKQKAIDYVEAHTPTPFLFYSYIEEKNARSLAISNRQDFRSIAILKTFIFRRYSPVKDQRFAVASETDLNGLTVLLKRFYRQYTFKTFTHIGYKGNYCTLKEDGQIVAGIQANPVSWRFLQMPGLSGWFMMNVLPLLSATRRFFNPACFNFVVLEGLYLKEGRQDLLPVLLESVLAHFGLHSAMCQIDVKDPLITLFGGKAMGRISGFQQDVKAHVMVKAVGIPENWILTQRPQYVSCFDFS